MKVSKKACLKIHSRDKENLLAEVENLKSGEALFKMLKIGFSVLEIQTLVLLDSKTIEKRVLEYIDKKKMPDEVEFFYEIKGLEYIGILKAYFCSAKSDEKSFYKANGKEYIYKKAIEMYSKYPLIQDMFEKKRKKNVAASDIQKASVIRNRNAIPRSIIKLS